MNHHGLSWAALDPSWIAPGLFWAALGGSGPLLGCSWAALGRSWGDLGTLLGALKCFSERSWATYNFEGSRGVKKQPLSRVTGCQKAAFFPVCACECARNLIRNREKCVTAKIALELRLPRFQSPRGPNHKRQPKKLPMCLSK